MRRRLLLAVLEVAGRLTGNDRDFVAALTVAYRDWTAGQAKEAAS